MSGIRLTAVDEATIPAPPAGTATIFLDDATSEPSYKDPADAVHSFVGPQGDPGDPGTPGADGEGVPTGGTTGQVLAKIDGTDFNTEWVDQTGGGGGAVDPIAELFGTPDTAFEFTTSSLTGLTAMGTPDTENADTTVPGHLFLKDDASGTAFCGRYAAVSAPCTGIVKVDGSTVRMDHMYAGMMVGEATPGKLVVTAVRQASRNAVVLSMHSPTSADASLATILNWLQTPYYVATKVNSTTNIDYLFSTDGWVWLPLLTAHNPSMTVGSIGTAMAALNSNGVSVAYDFLRIWNSALTFPV